MTYKLSKSGLFQVDINILREVEQAETYLQKSPFARDLLHQLAVLETPIWVEYKKDSNQEWGSGKNTHINWDPNVYLEVHDREHLSRLGGCGTNTPALIFLHEVRHAKWAITNPIGQDILVFLTHALYTNLEEARVIWETNIDAQALHEAKRTSHHGATYSARDVTDRNYGICTNTPNPHRHHSTAAIYGLYELNPDAQFAIAVHSRLQIDEMLSQINPPINESVLQDLRSVLDTHDRLGKKIIESVKAAPQAPLPLELQREYIRHVKHAVEVAAQFDGIV